MSLHSRGQGNEMEDDADRKLLTNKVVVVFGLQ